MTAVAGYFKLCFNLSMQVLRFLTFTLCGFPLPLSASDRYGVELSSMCLRALKMHFYCLRACAYVFHCAALECACTCVCAADSAGAAKLLESRAGNLI